MDRMFVLSAVLIALALVSGVLVGRHWPSRTRVTRDTEWDRLNNEFDETKAPHKARMALMPSAFGGHTMPAEDRARLQAAIAAHEKRRADRLIQQLGGSAHA